MGVGENGRGIEGELLGDITISPCLDTPLTYMFSLLPLPLWLGADLHVLSVALSTERGVLVVIIGKTEGGRGQVAEGRAWLGWTVVVWTARSGRSGTLEARGSTHRLQRADVNCQFGGSGRPEGSDIDGHIIIMFPF